MCNENSTKTHSNRTTYKISTRNKAMKCKYCDNTTIVYQIKDNEYFPVCLFHRSYRYIAEKLPDHIPPEQGLKYLERKQLVSWVGSCD